MSVFLRWGVFGIIGTAAVIYAYNVAKDLGEKRSAHAAIAPAPAEVPVESPPAVVPQAESRPAIPTADPRCEAEFVVAQRALEARRSGEYLDRLLRIPEVAWQEPLVRRQRLEKVATRWYQLEGPDPIPEALRIAVISDCVQFSPAP